MCNPNENDLVSAQGRYAEIVDDAATALCDAEGDEHDDTTDYPCEKHTEMVDAVLKSFMNVPEARHLFWPFLVTDSGLLCKKCSRNLSSGCDHLNYTSSIDLSDAARVHEERDGCNWNFDA